MILVVGGTGRAGAEVTTLLRRRGLPVRGLSRNAPADPVAGVEYVSGDVRDPVAVRSAMNGVEVVVSAITGFGPGAPGPRAIDNEGNQALIAAAEAAGVRRFVLVSVHDAGPDHPMELMRMKHQADERLRRSTVPEWVIVSPTAFMELWIEIIGGPIRDSGSAFTFGKGDNPINFVSASDVARIVELAVVTPELAGTTIAVGGPENRSFNDLIAEISRALSRRPSVRRAPIPVLRLAKLVLRPIRPDLARMVEAGIVMATADMSFDARPLQIAFPQVPLTTCDDAIERAFGPVGRRSVTPALSRPS